LSTFRLYQFTLNEGRSFYLLLPKLSTQQLSTFEKRLLGVGYGVSRRGGVLRATKGTTVIRLDRRGVCYSNADAIDEIAPALPEILAAKREEAPLKDLAGRYFDAGKSAAGSIVRLWPRMESSFLWRELRATGQCALTPDEHAVFKTLFLHASGQCQVISDFPTDHSVVKMIGKRQYFESAMDPSEAASSLAMVGQRNARNVYLPRDGLLRFHRLAMPSTRELAELFRGLGEWCYFSPETPNLV
jgi:hypothetical protein